MLLLACESVACPVFSIGIDVPSGCSCSRGRAEKIMGHGHSRWVPKRGMLPRNHRNAGSQWEDCMVKSLLKPGCLSILATVGRLPTRLPAHRAPDIPFLFRNRSVSAVRDTKEQAGSHCSSSCHSISSCQNTGIKMHKRLLRAAGLL